MKPARIAGPRALEFLGGGPLGDEALQFLLDRRLDPRVRHAGLHVGGDAEQARDLERRLPGAHGVGDAIAVDEPLIETRGLAAAEHLRAASASSSASCVPSGRRFQKR